MRAKLIILLSLLVAGVSARAEKFASETPAPAANPRERQQQLRQKLDDKMLNIDGHPAAIVIFSPTDTTTNHVGPVVAQTVLSELKLYGPVNARVEAYQLQDLTMEEMRVSMARYKADVIIALSLRNSNFDLYIYDRRAPYNIFAHSESIPDAAQLNLTASASQEYAKFLLRRTLFRYVSDEYFELPRQETLPVLQTEIPKWVASNESLSVLNREIVSRFYFSIGLGAAISRGRSGSMWNSNIIGIEGGLRLFRNLYLEGSWDAFSYNAFVGSLKYTFTNRDSPFKLSLGMGYGYVSNQKVWVLDETPGLGRQSTYFVPSTTLLFPIGDIYLKAELKVYLQPDFGKMIYTFIPGILVYF